MQHPPITLRYFDARGRAQFLRYYFKAPQGLVHRRTRGLWRRASPPWRAMRDDRARTGPFHKLPVLHWGDRLHRRDADDRRVRARGERRRELVVGRGQPAPRHADVEPVPRHDEPDRHAAVGRGDVSGRRHRRRREAHARASRAHMPARSSSRSSTGAGSTARATAASCSSTACSGRSSTWRGSCSARVGRWPQRRCSRGSTTSSRAARSAKPLLAERPCPVTARPERGRGHREDPAASRLSSAVAQRRKSRTRSVATSAALISASTNSAMLMAALRHPRMRSGFIGADVRRDLDETPRCDSASDEQREPRDD